MNERHWFDDGRFGMFVHWSHVSQQGWELSWPLVGGATALPESGAVPIDEYYAHALDFDPRQGSPSEWMALARRAGMRYAVLTTKHHDGFALFHTKHSDFSVEHAAYGADIVREFADAARSEGLRVGLYFSLCDWHHPDYPAFTESDKPYQFVGYRRPTVDAWERYLEFMYGQIRELLTNYGRIDLFWFDGGWERSPSEWRSSELEKMIRELQPDILINDRLPGTGDYATPEQFIPPEPPEGRWEACMTMNRSWGYRPSDTKYKSARDLVHALCETAGRGGNFLLNVSPMVDGRLPPEQVERLEAVGAWTERNGDAIFGAEAGLAPWQLYGPTTRKGDRVFLHLLMRPYETVTARGLPIRRIASARHIATGESLEFTTRASIVDELFGSDPIGEVVIRVPEHLVDDLATVIEVRIREVAS